MNKKEQAAFDAAVKEARLFRALNWTSPISPDVPIPSGSGTIVNGWLYHVYDNGRVEKACTSSVHHSFGNWDRTTTQNPRSLYSTELLAYKAMRHEMERAFAEKLAAVDAKIAALS